MLTSHSVNQSAVTQGRRQRSMAFIGPLLYEGMRDDDDPDYSDLTAIEKADFMAEARQALRQCDPIAQAVAEEMAAQAYAVDHGWDWPTLNGYSTDADANRELVIAEVRQKIRHWARVMCRAYRRHLQEGGHDADPSLSFEESFLQQLKIQNSQDAVLREQAKPKPALVRGFMQAQRDRQR